MSGRVREALPGCFFALATLVASAARSAQAKIREYFSEKYRHAWSPTPTLSSRSEINMKHLGPAFFYLGSKVQAASSSAPDHMKSAFVDEGSDIGKGTKSGPHSDENLAKNGNALRIGLEGDVLLLRVEK